VGSGRKRAPRRIVQDLHMMRQLQKIADKSSNMSHGPAAR